MGSDAVPSNCLRGCIMDRPFDDDLWPLTQETASGAAAALLVTAGERKDVAAGRFRLEFADSVCGIPKACC